MPESEAPQVTPKQEEPRYIAIRLSSIRTDTITDFSIHMISEGQHVPVLYRGADSAFPDDVRQRLIERGVQYLYIECQHEKQYRLYLEHNLSDILADPGVSSAEKSELLYLSATGIMEDGMAD
ncbi:MAG: hypothetical protein RBU21_14300, partial [FCB group bacterium]|nr:hypothetical protein [FCB group bacterium]